MRKLLLLLIPLLYYSCSKESSIDPVITYTLSEISISDPDCEGDQCSKVRLNYPVFSGDSLPSARANMFTNRNIAEVMGMGDVESSELNDLKRDAELLISQYQEFRSEFPESNQTWEIEVSMTHFYENDTLFSYGINSISYMGGAHPNSNIVFFNFDKRDGKVIRGDKLATSFQNLKQLAEMKFREEAGISATADLQEAGFNFTDNKFRLPANIAFTETGLELHYNKYEVAPYAYGDINIMIPYSELK